MRSAVVDGFAGHHGGVHVNGQAQVEVRRGEFALGQTAGNGLPHLRNTHFREALHCGGSAGASAHEGFDVALDDAAAFTRTWDQAQAQSALLSQTLGQWRSFHAAVRHSGSWSRCRLRCRGKEPLRVQGPVRELGLEPLPVLGLEQVRLALPLPRPLCLCRSEQFSNVFALLSEDAEHAVHGCCAAFLHANVKQDTVLERFKLHGGFVGFDFSEQLAAFHLVTNVFVPLSDDPVGHGVAQFGHANDFSHVSRSQKGNQIACRRPRRALKRREAGFPPQT